MRSENLNSYPVEAGIERPIHLTHAAERRLNFVGAKSLAAGEGHALAL